MTKCEALSALHSAIAEVSPEAARALSSRTPGITSKIFLVDLGINSIDYAEVVYIVMDNLNISIPIDMFSHINCIDNLIDILCILHCEQRAALQ